MKPLRYVYRWFQHAGLKDADILKLALFVGRKSLNLINVTSMCPFLDTSGIPQKNFRSFEGNSSIARELTYKLRHVIVHWLNKLGIFQSFYRETQLLWQQIDTCNIIRLCWIAILWHYHSTSYYSHWAIRKHADRLGNPVVLQENSSA